MYDVLKGVACCQNLYPVIASCADFPDNCESGDSQSTGMWIACHNHMGGGDVSTNCVGAYKWFRNGDLVLVISLSQYLFLQKGFLAYSETLDGQLTNKGFLLERVQLILMESSKIQNLYLRIASVKRRDWLRYRWWNCILFTPV